jgi:hypothetical protein
MRRKYGTQHVRISHVGISEVFMFMLFAFLNRSRELVRTANISEFFEVGVNTQCWENEGGMGRNNDKKGPRPRKRHCLKRKWPISFTLRNKFPRLLFSQRFGRRAKCLLGSYGKVEKLYLGRHDTVD